MKKVNKIIQLEIKKKSLEIQVDNLISYIYEYKKLLETSKTEYDDLISSTPIEELQHYPTAEFNELINNLIFYSKNIKTLSAKKNKIYTNLLYTIKKLNKLCSR